MSSRRTLARPRPRAFLRCPAFPMGPTLPALPLSALLPRACRRAAPLRGAEPAEPALPARWPATPLAVRLYVLCGAALKLGAKDSAVPLRV